MNESTYEIGTFPLCVPWSTSSWTNTHYQNTLEKGKEGGLSTIPWFSINNTFDSMYSKRINGRSYIAADRSYIIAAAISV